MSSSSSSSDSNYYQYIGVRNEDAFQHVATSENISNGTSTAPSSSSRSSGRIVTTVIAVLMAMAGATIMLSYGHGSDITGGGMQFSFYGRPMMGSSLTHGKAIMKNNDGIGNVIFDYETTSAADLYAAGETVIECIQVCD